MLRAILFVFYILILTPIAAIRRLFGYDPMRQKQWKNGQASVFVERNHTYTSEDLTTPR